MAGIGVVLTLRTGRRTGRRTSRLTITGGVLAGVLVSTRWRRSDWSIVAYCEGEYCCCPFQPDRPLGYDDCDAGEL